MSDWGRRVRVGSKGAMGEQLWMSSWMVAGSEPAGSSDGMASSRVSEQMRRRAEMR